MVAWDEKEFDKLADTAHRKYTADLTTAEDIAAAVMDQAAFRDYQMAKGDEVREWLAQAVRMARGEEEIR